MTVLLTWFRITALMLLAGAEINSQIEAEVAQERLPGHSTPAPPSHLHRDVSQPDFKLCQ
jgi:uncharacterized BrkB/YihY/UPF0761 family membrane protein